MSGEWWGLPGVTEGTAQTGNPSAGIVKMPA